MWAQWVSPRHRGKEDRMEGLSGPESRGRRGYEDLGQIQLHFLETTQR